MKHSIVLIALITLSSPLLVVLFIAALIVSGGYHVGLRIFDLKPDPADPTPDSESGFEPKPDAPFEEHCRMVVKETGWFNIACGQRIDEHDRVSADAIVSNLKTSKSG